MLMIPININLGRNYKLPNGMHILSKGVKIYVKDGDMHRTNGPAEIHPSGYKAWYKNGVKHRDKGRAVVYPDGREEYWINGKQVKKLKKGGH